MTKEEMVQLENEFNEKYSGYIKHLEEEAFLRSKKNQLKKLKRENRKNLGITTTKLLSYYLFVICNIILIYAMVAMWHFADLTYLGVIITDIIGQIMIFGIYSLKSYKETHSEEAIRLERDKLESLPDAARDKINQIFDMVESLGLTRENNYETMEEEPYLGDDEPNTDVINNEEDN